ncbi:hypothetical protein FQN51_000511 [Onygenales sp. PD_10]|nr:hypothetical protein FQN51_000511 [Onygenales sp. PD_10]
MNGTSLRSSYSSYGDPKYPPSISMGGAVPPPSRVLVDGYRSGLDSIQDESPRYNPLNPTHPRSSVLLNANDPVVMHLLTETAIGDSMQFEVLSFEEVEDLKKELSLLTNRIDASKRKLALEMKLQEAAMSLSRLSDRDNEDMGTEVSPKSRRRRSFFGRNSWGDHHRSDSELAASTRKCEELAQELWKLERRATELRRRVLEHTAGVLQMTHKGLKKRSATHNNPFPRSPDSIYEGPDGQENTQNYPPHEFDDRSLYRTADRLDEFGKGSIRQGLPRSGHGDSGSMDLSAVYNTEKKLEELNHRLRQMLIQRNSDQDVEPVPEYFSNGGPPNPVAGVEAHLTYLEKNMPSLASAPSQQQPSTTTDEIPEFVYEAEDRLEDLNNRAENILRIAGSSRSPTASYPSGQRRTLLEQLDYLEPAIDTIQKRVESFSEQKTILTTQIQQQRELNSKSDAQRDAHIHELSEQITALEKELELAQRDANGTREELGMVMDQLDAARQESMIREQQRAEEDANSMSGDKVAKQRAEEQLSAQAIKISELESALERLHEEHDYRLREAIEAKDRDMELERQQLSAQANKISELEATLDRVREEQDYRVKEVMESKENSNKELENQQLSAQASKISELEATLDRVREEQDYRVKEVMESKENSNKELENQQLSAQASKISELEAALDRVREEQDYKLKEAMEAKEHSEKEFEKLQSEYSEIETEMIRLRTELTMVQAELDGAYGSRAERAAQVAANPAIQKEIDDLNQRNISLTEEISVLRAEQLNNSNDGEGNSALQQRVLMLERELRETIDDYEVMTKASIEFEKEREKLETVLDNLRDRCEILETKLGEERVQNMGSNGFSNGYDRGPTETTSTMVLKNEFKRMMRDTRAENMKLLKAEQEERRRLEALVRTLKKEQNVGKSSLSQSTTAS